MNSFLHKWHIATIFTLSMITAFVSGCNDNNSNDKIIRVGVSPDYPPFEVYNNGEIVGFDIDVINKIAEYTEHKIQLHPLSFDNLIGALESKRIDIAISSLTVTEERAKKLDFSDIYYHNSFSIVYRNGQPLRSEDELKGKKIGAQTGTTMDKFLKRIGGVHIFSLNNNSIMIEELKLGRIDGVLIETAQAIEFVRSNLSLRYQKLSSLDHDGYSIAFPKDSKLRNEINSALNKMRDNGELATIQKKWIIDDITPDTMADVAATKTDDKTT